MTTAAVRVGILGCAGIAYKSAAAILHAESGCVVTAVASRSKEKAEAFVEELYGNGRSEGGGDTDGPTAAASSAVRIFGGDTGYDDLVLSDAVDALYIPLPTSLHKEWAIKAIRAGKHVVLEKPVAVHASDYAEMLAEAYRHGRFLLDGTMFPHHPRTAAVLDTASSGRLGTVDRIEANFTFLADEAFEDDNIRARKDGDPLGAIGDLGWYCVRYALMVFGVLGKQPVSAQVVDHALSKHGVPIDATCVVRFQDGCVLWFHCGFRTAYRQRFEICGTRQSLLLDDLVLPAKGPVGHTLKSSGLTEHALLTVHDEQRIETPAGPVHEVLLWSTFARVVASMNDRTADDCYDCNEWTTTDEATTKVANDFARVTLANQNIMDALMQSIENDGTVITVA